MTFHAIKYSQFDNKARLNTADKRSVETSYRSASLLSDKLTATHKVRIGW